MNWITSLINFIFMEYEGPAFRDIVSGKMVCYYRDLDGKRWMKDGRFSLFKVKAND